MISKQASTSFGFSGATLHDLYRAIESDTSLSAQERQRHISDVQQAARGASPSTPLAALAGGTFGAAIGYLLSKYFRAGPVRQVLSAVLGFGTGRALTGRSGPWRDIS